MPNPALTTFTPLAIVALVAMALITFGETAEIWLSFALIIASIGVVAWSHRDNRPRPPHGRRK